MLFSLGLLFNFNQIDMIFPQNFCKPQLQILSLNLLNVWRFNYEDGQMKPATFLKNNEIKTKNGHNDCRFERIWVPERMRVEPKFKRLSHQKWWHSVASWDSPLRSSSHALYIARPFIPLLTLVAISALLPGVSSLVHPLTLQSALCLCILYVWEDPTGQWCLRFFVLSLETNYQALSTLLPIKIYGILTYR